MIDHVIANEEGSEGVERMEIVDRIESDHTPVELTMKVKAKERVKMKWSERADWGEQAITKYREKVKNAKRQRVRGSWRRR